VYPALFLMYFISAAVTLLASLGLLVQASLPYNKTGRASILYIVQTLGHKTTIYGLVNYASRLIGTED